MCLNLRLQSASLSSGTIQYSPTTDTVTFRSLRTQFQDQWLVDLETRRDLLWTSPNWSSKSSNSNGLLGRVTESLIRCGHNTLHLTPAAMVSALFAVVQLLLFSDWIQSRSLSYCHCIVRILTDFICDISEMTSDSSESCSTLMSMLNTALLSLVKNPLLVST